MAEDFYSPTKLFTSPADDESLDFLDFLKVVGEFTSSPQELVILLKSGLAKRVENLKEQTGKISPRRLLNASHDLNLITEFHEKLSDRQDQREAELRRMVREHDKTC